MWILPWQTTCARKIAVLKRSSMEGPLIASKVKRRNSRLLGLRESVFLKLEMLPPPPNSNSCVTVVSTVELDNFYHGIYIYTSHLRYNKIDGIYWCNFRAKNVLKCVNVVSIQFFVLYQIPTHFYRETFEPRDGEPRRSVTFSMTWWKVLLRFGGHLGWGRGVFQCWADLLGGGFKHFLFSPLLWGRFPFLLVFFRWVETTNPPWFLGKSLVFVPEKP